VTQASWVDIEGKKPSHQIPLLLPQVKLPKARTRETMQEPGFLTSETLGGNQWNPVFNKAGDLWLAFKIPAAFPEAAKP
jgi:hypothetical protein